MCRATPQLNLVREIADQAYSRGDISTLVQEEGLENESTADDDNEEIENVESPPQLSLPQVEEYSFIEYEGWGAFIPSGPLQHTPSQPANPTNSEDRLGFAE